MAATLTARARRSAIQRGWRMPMPQLLVRLSGLERRINAGYDDLLVAEFDLLSAIALERAAGSTYDWPIRDAGVIAPRI